MSNNNHHNLQCGFAEELVSYLYGEINFAEKAEFEKHLDQCSNCDEELAAFGYVRSSINDWREEEFLALETPNIEIPYLVPQKIVGTSVNSNQSRSKLDGLRELFSHFSSWATATTAFAAFAVFVGVTILIINFQSPTDVSRINEVNNETNTSLQKSNQIADSNSLKPEDQIIKDIQVESKLNEDFQPETNSTPVEIETPLPKKAVALSSDKSPKYKVNTKINKKPNENLLADKNKILKQNRSKITVTENAPKLTDFSEEEDNSLRLADLFDEIGSK